MIKKNPSRRVYYSMGDVCEMFDLPASTIRFWEKRFKILTPKKNAKGNRLFTPQDIENLKLIHNLVKERGMTIDGADQQLQNQKSLLKKNISAIELLQQVRSALIDIRNEIDANANKSENQIIITQEVEPETEKPRYIEHTLFDIDAL